MNRRDRRIGFPRTFASSKLMGLIALFAIIASLAAGMLSPAGSSSAQDDNAAAEPQPDLFQQDPLPTATYPPKPTEPPAPTIPPTYPPKPTEPPVQPTATYPPTPTEPPATNPPAPTIAPTATTPGSTKPGPVVIYKYTCPPEFERTSDLEVMRDKCLESIKPVEFTVQGSGYARTQLAEGDVPLKTKFTDVPFGPIAIVETVPDGYGEPIAFCADGSDYTQAPVSEGGISWNHEPGPATSLTCLFFNLTTVDEDPDTFTIVFTKFYCPEKSTWDPLLFNPPGPFSYTDFYTGLDETCHEPPVAPVTLVLSNDGVFSRRVVVDEPVLGSSSTPIAFQAVANDLPIGRDLPTAGIYVREELPPGYGQMYIACYGELVDPPDFNAYRLDGYMTQVVPGDPGDDGIVTANCDLYNVPESELDTTVTVTKYTCPDDVVPTDNQSVLISRCLNPAPRSLLFGLTDSLGENYVRYPGDTRVAVVMEFADVPAGPITIRESGLEGYGEPVVFCSADPDRRVPFERVPVTVAGPAYSPNYAVSWDLDPDDPRPQGCLYFNFPAEGAPPTASADKEGDGKDQPAGDTDRDVPKDDEEVTTVEIVFEKRYCPRGPSFGRVRQLDVDGTPAPPARNTRTVADDLESTCDQSGEPVQVELSHSDSGFSTSVLLGRGETVVEVPEGLLRVVELALRGYSAPWLVCRNASDDLSLHEGLALTTVEGDVEYVMWTGLSIRDAVDGRCTLYNLPLEGKPDVTVTKFTCPDDVARSDNYFELSVACQKRADPVEFTLTDALGERRTQVAEDIVFAQQTEFKTVPYGPVTFAETVPEGYGEPFVFCSADPDSRLPFVRMPVTDGAVSWELAPDDADGQGCLFFNFSLENTATVNVSKYTCPDDLRIASEFNLMGTLILRCRQSTTPVTFTLTDQASGDEHVQRAEGTIPLETSFLGIRYGDFTLSEALPAKYGEPYVFCSDTVVDGRNTDYQKMFPSGGSISCRLDPAAAGPFHCVFFNVLAGSGGVVPDALSATLPLPAGSRQTRAFTGRLLLRGRRRRGYWR